MFRLVIIPLLLSLPAFGQDSLTYQQRYEQADSVTRANLQRLDSIQQATAMEWRLVQTKYDSVRRAGEQLAQPVQHTIDSLTQLGQPVVELQNRLDSLHQASTQPLSELEEKWSLVHGQAVTEVQSLQLPPPWGVGQQQLVSSLNGLDITAPSSGLTLTSLPWNESLQLGVPGLDNTLPDLPGGLSQIEVVDKGPLNQIEQYKNQTTQLAKGNPDQLVDTEVAKLEEVKILQDQKGMMEGQLSMQEMKDAQTAKQQYVQLARKAAMSHFEGKFDQVDAAVNKMKQYKRKFDDVPSLKDLPKKIPNEMHGLPFWSRCVWALALQLQQQGDWMLDFNPSLGYRFSGRIVGGAGWNQRIAYNFKQDTWVQRANIYGPRIFGEYFLTKNSLAIRLESNYDFTQINYYNKLYVTETGKEEWVWGIMVGLRKVYKIHAKLHGNLQALYNIYDPHNYSPHPRFNLRIGFEFGKKK